MFRSGFIAIVGLPNVGKSTLLNALIGEKISIVSKRPQTTRNTVTGVVNRPGAQMIFIDTPGIHEARGLLNERMVREALSALKSADAVVYMVEPWKGVTGEDRMIIKNLGRLSCPVALAINKTDAVAKERILPLIAEFSALYPFKDIVPVSALKNDGVDTLAGVIEGVLPEGPRYFSDDAITDVPERVIAAEMIREKVFTFVSQEVPYSTGVVVEGFKEKKGRGVVVIQAAINVEREGQKGIVIGKGGAMLKRIGTAARKDIEALLGAKVFLELFVRVNPGWTRKAGEIREFGH
ncbi:MAG: GTPase Era [Deltaproteobacteria bacterium]|nr:GTPase Era [Deltaproteobacteria bacterium]